MDVSDYDPALISTAQIDDARPLQFLVNAILERGGFLLADFAVVGRRPNLSVLRSMVEAVFSMAGDFIDLDADYSVDSYASFPRTFTEEQIATSAHPMAVSPGIGSASATPRALDAYRALLADMLFWLTKFRYRAPSAAWLVRGTTGYWFNDLPPEINSEERRRTEVSIPTEIYSASSYVEASDDKYRSSAYAKEGSGFWIANERSIDADVKIVWMFRGCPYGLSDLNNYGLPGHTGKYEAQSRSSGRSINDIFRTVSRTENGTAMFGADERMTLNGETSGKEYTLRSRVLSPDGSEFVETETRETFEPYPGANFFSSSAVTREASDAYGTHRPGIDSEVLVCPAHKCVCIIPETSRISRPASPPAPLPGTSADVSRSITASIDYGAYYVFPVLDYGAYYHFAKSQKTSERP